MNNFNLHDQSLTYTIAQHVYGPLQNIWAWLGLNPNSALRRFGVNISRNIKSFSNVIKLRRLVVTVVHVTKLNVVVDHAPAMERDGLSHSEYIATKDVNAMTGSHPS
ncbi:hypothetical protein E6Q11_02665 [Candidatus Dojkabacteria bacterium]|uniref:Uncharacterized protein n=1 Tax=Candidatus Dojkabacteria bacterium TaxID=2099670 RepID=A0A5C7J7U0_9BACT|nr:MAG: hypothetical protein E6Q11_02665 [Candidatus Dojkabacteria bacterium]